LAPNGKSITSFAFVSRRERATSRWGSIVKRLELFLGGVSGKNERGAFFSLGGRQRCSQALKKSCLHYNDGLHLYMHTSFYYLLSLVFALNFTSVDTKREAQQAYGRTRLSGLFVNFFFFFIIFRFHWVQNEQQNDEYWGTFMASTVCLERIIKWRRKHFRKTKLARSKHL
jgi:hypothetical protein